MISLNRTAATGRIRTSTVPTATTTSVAAPRMVSTSIPNVPSTSVVPGLEAVRTPPFFETITDPAALAFATVNRIVGYGADLVLERAILTAQMAGRAPTPEEVRIWKAFFMGVEQGVRLWNQNCAL